MKSFSSPMSFLSQKRTLFFLLTVLLSTGSMGATRTASVTGNWSSTATWGGSAVPTSSDAVVINSGVVVTVDGAAVASIVTVNAAAAATGITISGTNSLTVTGAVSITAPTATVTSEISVGAGSFSAASVTLNGGTSGRLAVLSLSTGTVTVSGYIAFGGTPAQTRLTFLDAGILNIGGTLDADGLFTASTGTVNFNGGSSQTIPAYTYYHLTCSGAGAKTGATMTVNGNLTISTGSSLVWADGVTITVGGSVAGGGAMTMPGGGGGSRAYVNCAGDYTFTGTISSISKLGMTFNGAGDQSVTGTVTWRSVSVNKPSGTMFFPVTPVLNSGTSTFTAGDIDYNGGSQSVLAGTYPGTVNLSGTGTKTLAGDVTLGTGDALIIGSGVTLATSTYLLTLGGDLVNHGVFTSGPGGVTLTGTSAQSIDPFTTTGPVTMTKTAGIAALNAALSAGSLTVNGAGGTLKCGGAVTTGALAVTAGTLDPNGFKITPTTFTVGGSGIVIVDDAVFSNNYAITPTSSPSAGAIFRYTAANPTFSTAFTYQDLEFTGAGTAAIGGTLTLQGDLVNSGGGTLDFGSNAVTITGNVSATIIAGFTTTGLVTMGKSGGTATATGNITCGSFTSSANGTLNLGSGLTHTVSGAFTKSTGTINLGSSVLHLNGSVSNTGGGWISGTGTLEYGDGNQPIINASQYNLTLSGSGVKTLSAGLTVLRTLTVNTGATLVTNNFAVILKGDFVNNGTFTGGSTAVTLDSTTTQNISGFTTTGAISVNKKGGSATLLGDVNAGSLAYTSTANGTTLAIASGVAMTLTGGIVMPPPGSSATVLDIGAGSVSCASIAMSATTTPHNNVIAIASGTLTVTGNITSAGPACFITVTGTGTLYAGGTFLSGTAGTFTAGSGTVNFNAAGDQTLSPSGTRTFNNLTLSGSGIKTTTNVTVNGILSMEGAATASAAPTYGANATLQYNTATARTAGVEWLNTFTPTGGVVIANTGAITLNTAKDIVGPLTINGGATLHTSASNYGITLENNFTNNGTLTANASPISISGGGTQTISGFTTAGLVSILKTGGTATLTGNMNGGACTMNAIGGALDLGAGLTHTFSGDITNVTGTVIPNTSAVNFTGTQTLPGWSFYDLICSGTGIKTVAAGTTLNVARNWSVESPTVLSTTAGATIAGNISGSGAITMGSGTITINGDWTNNGAFTPGTGAVTYAGDGAQSIGPLEYYTLMVHKTTGLASLAGVATVDHRLLMAGGLLATGNHSLHLGSSADVVGSGAGKYVLGNLNKSFAAGPQTFTFAIGDESVYTPVTVAFANISTGGSLTASTTHGQHPELASSGIDPAKSVNRYWTLSNDGIAFDSYAANFNFAAADVPAGANPDNFTVSSYGPTWATAGVGTRTATSTQGTGFTSFSDFAIGELKNYTLDIVSVGGGTVSKNPDLPSYAHGTIVQLTATPAVGYSFTGWSGAVTGATNPISVTMDAAKSVTANFAINTYALTITAVNGTVAKAPDQPFYDHGTVVQLTATPAIGYTFTGWSGAVTGATNPISVTMDAAKSVTANFAINTYALTITAVNGTVAKVPDQLVYDHGTVVQLTATPAVGYLFTGWSGAVTGATNPISVTMDAAKSVTANFAINTYALTITAVNGTVAKVPDQPFYDHGTVVQLTATPAIGYTFTGWSGAVTGATNPISVTMDAAKSVTANFAINTYALTITAVNGTVAKVPDQLVYDHGTVVQLTATPAVGYTFTGWTGDVTGATNPISVTMDAAKSVTAIFAINTYALTITAVNGTVAKVPDQLVYDHGTVVQLTATPAVGYTFTGWTGDVTGATNPISVTMDAAKSVTAIFAINTYALTITAVNGTVAKVPDQLVYDHGTVVQLTATPAVGYHFVNWTGDASGAITPVSVTMDAAKSVTANFAINTYALTITAVNGTVAKVPDLPLYDHGTVVQLTATPAIGYTFTGWSGAVTGATNPVSVTMDAAKSVTANFAINTYALTITAVNGAVAKVPDLPLYDHGTVVQLTATPATGYHFVNWTSDATGITSPVSVTMDAAKSVTANFAINTYALTITAVNGTVAKVPDQLVYDHGTVVQLTATPAVGYAFTGWSGAVTGATNPISVTMDAAKSVTANFAINTYALTITAVNGTVAKVPDQLVYDHGTVVQLTATPAVGYAFTGWSGAVTGATNPISVTMDAAKSVTANFAINTYALTITAVNGTVAKVPDLPLYDHGTIVQLTATPAIGYTFTGWFGAVTGATNPISVTMDAAKSVTANFAINTYALTITAVNGTVAKVPDQLVYEHGTVVQLTATPAVGYAFTGWSGAVTGATNPISVTMDAAKSVTANFAINTYALTITAVNGTVAKVPDQPFYDHGTVVQLTATPAIGYTFTGWSGAVTEATNPISVTMDAAKSVTANFAINTYALAITAVNGTVAKVPDLPLYDHGTVVQLTAAPAVGYSFTGWSGALSGATNPISVTMDAAKSVTANFAINTYALAITAVNGTVAKVPDLPLYDHGTVVQLTAAPAVGYSFTGWSGALSGATNPISVTMDAAKSVTANFTINTYALTITAVNGTVAKVPDLPLYDHGTVVQLTAMPAIGYTFTGWSGAVTGATNPISVTMDAAKSVTANFAINTYALTITAVNGTVAKVPDQLVYEHGTVVQLTATPAVGYAFTGWSGAVTGATNPISVTMDAAKSVTANFTINTYALTITAVNGTVAKVPDLAEYDHGTVVQLTATPAIGYTFTGWSGAVTGATNPISVTMDAAKSVTANFAINTYALTITAVNGTVAKVPDLPLYDHGTVVQLTATPAIGYTFTGWSGAVTGATNPISVTMDAAKSVTVNFAINTYALTITAVNGTVAKVPDLPLYDHGTIVQLTATPAIGYTFTGWSGAVTGATNPISVTMDAAKNVTANFAINTYALTITAVNGTVAKVPDLPLYDHGTVVQLTATPAVGYTFTGWSGAVTGATNPISVTMDAAKSVTANFAINTYALTITAVNGTVAKVPDLALYDHGTVVQLTATPAIGYTFTGWSGAVTGATNPISVTMDAAKSVTANFAINTYALTITAVNGTVAKVPDQLVYEHGTVVQLTATPAVGYAFTGWSGAVTGATNPISVTMDAAKSVTANFAINTYALTITAVNGTVAKVPDQPFYDHGTVVQLTATPAVGYTFTGWSGAVTGATNPISVTMDAAKSVTANFAINTYALTITAVNGTVAKVPDQLVYDHGTVVQLTATPSVGYTFTGWSGAVTGATNPISVTMDAAKSVTANFAINTYALTITAVNGTVAKVPDQLVYEHGTVVQLTATPAAGYSFTGWSGAVTGATNPISVTMDAAKSVTANFAINTYALTITAVNGTVAKVPDLPLYDHGTVVQLTATPAAGYHFVNWTGDATGSTSPVSVTMDAAKSVTANFAINTYLITVTQSANGTIAPATMTVNHGDDQLFTITAAVGYHVTAIIIDGVPAGAGTSYTFTAVIAPHTITATFAATVFTISGTTGVAGTVMSWNDGELKSTIAGPDGSYSFTVSYNWSGTVTPTLNGYSFAPPNRVYAEVLTEQPGQDYVGTPFVTANIKVFLAGAYVATSMRTTLNASGLLPLTSDGAYPAATYRCTAKTIGAIPNADIVDWVLVELRTGTDSITNIAVQSAFVNKDGVVVDVNGSSPLTFNGISSGSYYLVVRHRNHLPVMSAAATALTAESALYDFTTAQAMAYGTNPMKLLSSGVFGMMAGDADRNGIVTFVSSTSDRLALLMTVGLADPTLPAFGYLDSDVNLDGVATFTGPTADRLVMLQTLGLTDPTTPVESQVPR